MSMTRSPSAARRAAARSLVAALASMAAACGAPSSQPVEGDAENGRLLLRQFGCGSCHRIPGVATADGTTGPPLDGVAQRVYIGGFVPNTPRNMARWIREPTKVDPRTAMPDLQVGDAHARDMTAYLYTLR
jgi:cytochrome c2